MNFLAHAYLSGDSDHILLGNFIADFVKGNAGDFCRGDVYRGIVLHREIDAFTDRHRLVAASKQRLWSRHGHYSAVIVDIFYDHFLAKNWQQYSRIPLEEFAAHVYATMQRFDSLLPERAKQLIPQMITGNWLVNYGKLEGVDRAMHGMARRASFRSSMADGVEDLQDNYEGFAEDFRNFFPELIGHSMACLRELQAADPSCVSAVYLRKNPP